VPGHAWVFLNWICCLQAIGFDVVMVDRLEPEMLRRPGQLVDSSDESCWFHQVTRRAGLDQATALLINHGRDALGMSRAELVTRCEQASVLFNFMGYLDDTELLMAFRGPRVFVDIDPGFPQMWHELGLWNSFDNHDAFVTVGLGVGSAESLVPTCGREWIPTLPPIDISTWSEVRTSRSSGRLRISDVVTWRGPFAPIDYRGRSYGLRVHEMRPYASLPRHFHSGSFELVLSIDPEDAADAQALESGGWCLRDPGSLVGLDEYRRFIAGSDVELTVAKQMYVRSRSGWFSDRSACYLASGRPVLAQDTGFSAFLPSGEGLIPFGSTEEAIEALTAVEHDQERHRVAARGLAQEHLDGRRILRTLSDKLGLS
jgi:hypothetical protein